MALQAKYVNFENKVQLGGRGFRYHDTTAGRGASSGPGMEYQGWGTFLGLFA